MGAHFVVLSSHGHVNGLTGAASAAGGLLLIVHPAFASIRLCVKQQCNRQTLVGLEET